MAEWHGRTQRIERPPIAQINALAARLRAQGRDLINLGQGILGLPPPASALQAVRDYLSTSAPHEYSPDPGLPEVLERVAAFLRDHKRIRASADDVMLTCGANQAFVNALLALSQPGDEIVFFGPHYFDHVFAMHLADCVPVEVGLVKRERRFAIDWPALERALSPRTRCVVLVSPANPGGMVLSEPDTVRLCELCQGRGLWLISDETYDLLVFPPAVHCSPAALGIHDRVVVLGSFSKTFGMAAWRIGYLHGPPRFVEETIKVQDTLVVCAPVPSQWAIAAALDEAEDYCAAARDELVRRRDALLDALEPVADLEPTLPDGATFLLAEITTGEASFDYARQLLQTEGVVAVPGSAFGRHGERHLRLSFGNQSVERIAAAGQRLQRFAVRRSR